MTTHTATVSAILLALCLGSAYTLRSPGCGTSLPHGFHPGHSHLITLQVDDPGMGMVDRYFRLHIPKEYDINNETPMVVDYHGWTGDSHSQEKDSQFVKVADENEPFFVATPDGMGDNPEGGNWGSFNCSRTDGPLGPPCDIDRERWGSISCYSSCPLCDSMTSCDWTSCHDDIAFTRALVDYMSENFCLDRSSFHQSGVSNGGMFSYFMASQLSDIFASIAPVAGAPLIGFGDLPQNTLSLIDIHGVNDDTIPYDLDHAEGQGPHKSVISWDGYYYEEKEKTINKWVSGCSAGPEPYPTEMDGQTQFQCQVWTGCQGGTSEVVACTADHGHDYPFGEINQYIQGARIMWNFMKSHPSNPTI